MQLQQRDRWVYDLIEGAFLAILVTLSALSWWGWLAGLACGVATFCFWAFASYREAMNMEKPL